MTNRQTASPFSRNCKSAPTHFRIPRNDERSGGSAESKTVLVDLGKESERSYIRIDRICLNLPLTFSALNYRRSAPTLVLGVRTRDAAKAIRRRAHRVVSPQPSR